jgi:hypothetical protein
MSQIEQAVIDVRLLLLPHRQLHLHPDTVADAANATPLTRHRGRGLPSLPSVQAVSGALSSSAGPSTRRTGPPLPVLKCFAHTHTHTLSLMYRCNYRTLSQPRQQSLPMSLLLVTARYS